MLSFVMPVLIAMTKSCQELRRGPYFHSYFLPPCHSDPCQLAPWCSSSNFSFNQTLMSDWYGTSCRLAVVLIESSIQSGSRSEMDWVVGFKLGNLTLLAFDQST